MRHTRPRRAFENRLVSVSVGLMALGLGCEYDDPDPLEYEGEPVIRETSGVEEEPFVCELTSQDERCLACVKTNCCAAFEACLAGEACSCSLECVSHGGIVSDCMAACAADTSAPEIIDMGSCFLGTCDEDYCSR